MAKIKLDPMITSMTGKLGGVIFRRSKDGYAIVSMAPAKSRAKPSPAQLEHQARFKNAVAYAQGALEDPEVRARYEERARELKKTPFAVAVSDYFKDRNLLGN
ncbi:MAG TPA: hypothetical protein VF918_02310 [Anaerolineales bacterium]